MKKNVPLLLCLLLALNVSAQDSAALKKHYMKVFSQALMYNDVNAAINSLHGYLAVDNSLLYKDTLSMMYFTTKSYYSSLMLAEEVYKTDATNTLAMARAAECYDELGDPKTATELFEQVANKTKNPYHIYKLAVCQYQLKRTAECEVSAKAVMADTTSKKIGVNFTLVNGEQQAVPIDAAAANLLGVLQMDAKNYVQAKTFFNKALTFYPLFAGAKQNLDACEKNMKGAAKPPAKTPTKPKG